MEFCALASGSSGNCFYVKEGDAAILIDAGISSKQICERLNAVKQPVEGIKGVFITHEHTDHIRGVDVFANKFNIPVYVNKKTRDSCFLCRDEELVNVIKNNESVKVNGLSINAFSKSHDAADPVSYLVEGKKSSLGVMTDIGFACKNVIENVKDCDSLILESNHDVKMLENGPYPYYLKKRISSELGHISNYDSALLVLQHGSKKLKQIMLAHLSQNNNTPEVALKTFNLLKERKDLRVKVNLSERENVSDYVKLKN